MKRVLIATLLLLSLVFGSSAYAQCSNPTITSVDNLYANRYWLVIEPGIQGGLYSVTVEVYYCDGSVEDSWRWGGNEMPITLPDVPFDYFTIEVRSWNCWNYTDEYTVTSDISCCEQGTDLTVDTNGSYTLDILEGTPMIVEIWEIDGWRVGPALCNAWNSGSPCPTNYSGTIPTGGEYYFNILYADGEQCFINIPNSSGQRNGTQLGEVEAPALDIHLYPNPAVSFITLENKNAFDFEIEIISVTGQQIIQTNLPLDSLKTIDLSDFANGFYLVRYINPTTQKVEAKKFTIMK